MMWSTARPRLRRGLTLMSAAGLLAGAGGLVLAGPASAATASGSSITVKYTVNGSTYLKSVKTTATLGPGTLKSTVNLKTAKLSASLTLPAATVSYSEFGIIPVTATTEFVQDGPTTGKVNVNTGAVSTTSKITLKLTALTIAGLPTPVPAGCETATPAVVALKSLKGFSVVKGGKLSGTYTIPKFAHCGLLTPVLNLTIPGAGNTIALKLGSAKVVG